MFTKKDDLQNNFDTYNEHTNFNDDFFFYENEMSISKSYFPSISDYFYIPIIFDYLDIHCPTVLWQLGQLFFHENNFFSNMDFFNFYLKAFKWKSLSEFCCLQQK